ncbi:uncharacterized protein LOC110271798 isoform X2 [Arachis ipaensis]|uniref:uncharacterized protein LOC110271798 isoform X2 n=1 Tax=Arachis ipaensis TaxID=130454 RepID=UPI000A2B4E67|nr:uncharacterized protein LOC110271798 isoform X2 [Arachis ipaensis]
MPVAPPRLLRATRLCHCNSSNRLIATPLQRASTISSASPSSRLCLRSSSAPPLSPKSSALPPASKSHTRRATPVPPLHQNRASSAPLVPKRAISTRFSPHSIA